MLEHSFVILPLSILCKCSEGARYKVATGNLINSITYKYSYTNGQYKIQITGAPYLINIDRGRRAGAKPPPVKPLLAWIKIRRIPINMELAMRGLNYAINLGFKNKKGYFLPPSAVKIILR